MADCERHGHIGDRSCEECEYERLTTWQHDGHLITAQHNERYGGLNLAVACPGPGPCRDERGNCLVQEEYDQAGGDLFEVEEGAQFALPCPLAWRWHLAEDDNYIEAKPLPPVLQEETGMRELLVEAASLLDRAATFSEQPPDDELRLAASRLRAAASLPSGDDFIRAMVGWMREAER